MPQHARRHPLAAAILVVALAAPLATLSASAGAAGRSTTRPGPTEGPGCTAILDRPDRAAEVRRSQPTAFAEAARRNGRAQAELERLSHDETLWLDRCGRAYYVEPAQPGEQPATEQTTSRTTARSVVDGATTADAFALQSRPGSARTLFLDFDGATTTGTAWNSTANGSSFTSPAYDTDGNPAVFSDAERTQVVRAWQTVAEDFAPFDVNVTTLDPGTAALDRTSSSDLVYGATIVVTPSNPVYVNDCGSACGGIAYVGVFNTSGSSHLYYQPGFVFTRGTGTTGKSIAEAASHEAGHHFGLNHDGTATTGYYAGSAPWAPIMGVGYNQPVTQWSRGEYAGANNAQDDLAVIATGAPLVADDIGSTAGSAAALTTAGPAEGLISTRTDTDAFAFTGANETTVTVRAALVAPDLDVALTVLDATTGAVVASANPTTTRVSAAEAAGTGASVTFTAPAEGRGYLAVVDGAGQGDPTAAGGYSDYGSLGRYSLSLATGTPTSSTPPLAVTASTLPPATVGTAYGPVPAVAASGGTAPYRYTWDSARTDLRLDAATGAVSGTPTSAGTLAALVTVTDAVGATASVTVSITVSPAAVAPLVITTTSLPQARLRKAYRATVATTGGTLALTWTTAGLPAGLSATVSADTRSLVVAGTPSVKGTSTVTVTVRDAAGVTTARTYTLTIR